MSNGLKDLLEKHQQNSEDGSFESLMSAFGVEVLGRLERLEAGRWKTVLLVGAIAITPIVVVILDKVL